MLNTGLPPNHISGIRLHARRNRCTLKSGIGPKERTPDVRQRFASESKATTREPNQITRCKPDWSGSGRSVSSTRLVESKAELPLAAGAGVCCKDRVTRQPAFWRLLGPQYGPKHPVRRRTPFEFCRPRAIASASEVPCHPTLLADRRSWRSPGVARKCTSRPVLDRPYWPSGDGHRLLAHARILHRKNSCFKT